MKKTSPPPRHTPQPLKPLNQRNNQFKPAAAQLKTAVPAKSNTPSVAPAGLKPTPQPRVAQAKMANPLPVKTPRAAPPAYRPQAVPKVLQRKTATTAPAKLAQAVPQTRNTNTVQRTAVASRPPARTAQLKSVASKPTHVQQAKRPSIVPALPARLNGTIQRASDLVRHDFSYGVKKGLILKPGQHRRHIIANHLMKNMLQAWWDCHEDDAQGAQTSVEDLQGVLDDMNNNVKNLKPGPGPANSAIGMLSTAIGKKLDGFAEDEASPMEIAASISDYQGFQQGEQKKLMAPVLPVFKKDPDIRHSHEEALEMAEDIHFSTDFDWPGGTPAQWEEWSGVYHQFLDVQTNPQNYNFAKLNKVITAFFALKAPSGKH